MFSLSFLATLSLAIAVPLQSIDYVVHESRHPSNHPTAWVASHRAGGEVYLPVKIGLKQNNMDRLYDELMAVSHPDSPNYGEHWSPERVKNFFRPSEETKEAVVGWLNEAGFELERVKVSHGGGWVEVGMTVEEAEKLFKSEYHVYEHESGSKHIACNSYSVPKHVQPHIDLITPTIHFDSVPKSRSPNDQTLVRRGGKLNLGALGATGQGPKIAPSGLIPSFLDNLLDLLGIHLGFDDLSNCDKMITPNCLRALYNALDIPFTSGRTSYGIVEYTPQAYRGQDLDLFFHNFSRKQVGQRPVLVSIDGGIVQTTDVSFSANGESNLDLEYAMALVGKHQPVTLYQVGDIVEGASFNNFLDAIDGSYCSFEGGDDPNQDGVYPDTTGQPGAYGKKDCGTVKPADVISTSYGYNEADLSYSYAQRQCAEYGKLGMMGVTILYSSGDFGVAGNGGFCLGNGGTFNPSFPGGCPYVTSVGATQIKNGSTVDDPEEACETVIYSGGGFSNYFDIPDYQKSAVAEYFANHNPPYTSAQYNNSRTSRGFPDISANGANYVVAVDGKAGLVYGTSASTPVVGSFFTMINNARSVFRKGPIGFINPTIYSEPFKSAFNDITSGGNQGCGTPGFEAVEGWDPVTGLGTPDVTELLALWTAF